MSAVNIFAAEFDGLFNPLEKYKIFISQREANFRREILIGELKKPLMMSGYVSL